MTDTPVKYCINIRDWTLCWMRFINIYQIFTTLKWCSASTPIWNLKVKDPFASRTEYRGGRGSALEPLQPICWADFHGLLLSQQKKWYDFELEWLAW